MEIWKAIYNSYSENQLFVSPFGGQDVRKSVEDFVDTLNPTPEQGEQFQMLFGELLCETEMRVFHAGFKIARQLDLE